jgi:cobalamin biosynthesis protein CobC
MTMGKLQHGGEPPAGAGPDGPDWLDLSTGIAPFAYPFSPPAAGSWRKLPRQHEEQAALAAAGQYFGLGRHSDVCLGPGSQALLQLLPELLPTGVVGVLSPTYGEHAYRWAQAGHRVCEVTDLANLPSECRYAVLVNPNNPTGAVHQPGDLLPLAASLAARDGYLIMDEAFCDVLPKASLAAHAGVPGLLILRSFGKFFGLAGLRLGFLLGPVDVITKARARMGPWPVNGPALAIAAQAYGDGAWIAAHRQTLAAQAAKLQTLLGRHGEIVGGTDLFVLLNSNKAPDLFARLATAHIHIRDFAENQTWLRFGLPGCDAAWTRLQDALSN